VLEVSVEDSVSVEEEEISLDDVSVLEVSEEVSVEVSGPVEDETMIS